MKKTITEMNKKKMIKAMKALKCWKYNRLWEAGIYLLNKGLDETFWYLYNDHFNTLMKEDIETIVDKIYGYKGEL